jgi:pimeloyl-ACP methyl ester carboxylesterase
MEPLNLKNSTYIGSMGRRSLFDLEIPSNWNREMLIFVHGFMGFKDWGAWHLVQDYFVSRGYGFAKFNLSHNGGTVDNRIDFPDEEAFARNTYSIEIQDVLLFQAHLTSLVSEPYKTTLIGHSRGGGAVLLSTQYRMPYRLVMWASISDIEMRFQKNEALAQWEKEGVRTVRNGRTMQDLPQFFELYLDYEKNKTTLDIQKVCKQLTIPTCVVHGSADDSVSIEEGKNLALWLNTPLNTIEKANHVFGTKHPWNASVLSKSMTTTCEITQSFIEKNR